MVNLIVDVKILFELAKVAYSESIPLAVSGFTHCKDIAFGDFSTTFGYYDDSLRASIFKQKKIVVIAFRGSNNTKNWTAHNIRFAVRKLAGAVKTFAQHVFDDVKKIYPRCRYLTTGHSLGGSLATYCAVQNGLQALAIDSPGIGDDYDPDPAKWKEVAHIHANSIASCLNRDPIPVENVIYLSGGSGILATFTNHLMDNIRSQLDKSRWLGVSRGEQLYKRLGGAVKYSTLSDGAQVAIDRIASIDHMKMISSRISARIERVSKQDAAGEESEIAIGTFRALQTIPGLGLVGSFGLAAWSLRDLLLTRTDGLPNRIAQTTSPIFAMTTVLSPVINTFGIFSGNSVMKRALSCFGRDPMNERTQRILAAINQGINDLSQLLVEGVSLISRQNTKINKKLSEIINKIDRSIDLTRQGFALMDERFHGLEKQLGAGFISMRQILFEQIFNNAEQERRQFLCAFDKLKGKKANTIDKAIEFIKRDVNIDSPTPFGVFNGLSCFQDSLSPQETFERFIALARRYSADQLVNQHLAVIFKVLKILSLNPLDIDERTISNVNYCSFIVENSIASADVEILTSARQSIQEILKPTKDAINCLLGNRKLVNDLFREYNHYMQILENKTFNVMEQYHSKGHFSYPVTKLLPIEKHFGSYLMLDLYFFLLKLVCCVNEIDVDEKNIYSSGELKNINVSNYIIQPEFNIVRNKILYDKIEYKELGMTDSIKRLTVHDWKHNREISWRFKRKAAIIGCARIGDEVVCLTLGRKQFEMYEPSSNNKKSRMKGCIKTGIRPSEECRLSIRLQTLDSCPDKVFGFIARSDKRVSLLQISSDKMEFVSRDGPVWTDQRRGSKAASTIRTMQLSSEGTHFLCWMIFKAPFFELYFFNTNTKEWKQCQKLSLGECQTFDYKVQNFAIDGVEGVSILFRNNKYLESYWYHPIDDKWERLPRIDLSAPLISQSPFSRFSSEIGEDSQYRVSYQPKIPHTIPPSSVGYFPSHPTSLFISTDTLSSSSSNSSSSSSSSSQVGESVPFSPPYLSEMSHTMHYSAGHFSSHTTPHVFPTDTLSSSSSSSTLSSSSISQSRGYSILEGAQPICDPISLSLLQSRGVDSFHSIVVQEERTNEELLIFISRADKAVDSFSFSSDLSSSSSSGSSDDDSYTDSSSSSSSDDEERPLPEKVEVKDQYLVYAYSASRRNWQKLPSILVNSGSKIESIYRPSDNCFQYSVLNNDDTRSCYSYKIQRLPSPYQYHQFVVESISALTTTGYINEDANHTIQAINQIGAFGSSGIIDGGSSASSSS